MLRRARLKWTRKAVLRLLALAVVVVGTFHLFFLVPQTRALSPATASHGKEADSPRNGSRHTREPRVRSRWVEELHDFAKEWIGSHRSTNLTHDNENFCRSLRDHVWNNMVPSSSMFSQQFLEAVQAQYNMHQAVEMGNPAVDQKYIVWSLSGGLGNRFQSLASTMIAAMLSKRVLLLKDWFTPLPPNSKHNKPMIFPASKTDDYQMEALQKLFWFSNPQISEKGPRDPNSMLLCPLLPMMSLTEFEAKNTAEFRDASKANSKDVPSFLEGHIKVDIAARHDKKLVRWNRLACRNVTHSFEEKFVYIWTNQYYLPLFFANPVHAQQLRKWFPDGRPFGAVSKLLVLPSLPVMKRVLGFFEDQASRYPTSPLIVGQYEALQIRAFSFGAEMEKLGGAFQECQKEFGQSPTKPFLLATMHQSVVERFRKEKGTALVRMQSSKAAGDQLTGKGSSPDQEALADILLLSLSRKLFLSPGSTFGTFAASFGDLTAVRVNWKLRDAASRSGGFCEVLPSREPCFMSWFRYDHLFQRSNLGLGNVPRDGLTCKLVPIEDSIMHCK